MTFTLYLFNIGRGEAWGKKEGKVEEGRRWREGTGLRWVMKRIAL